MPTEQFQGHLASYRNIIQIINYFRNDFQKRLPEILLPFWECLQNIFLDHGLLQVEPSGKTLEQNLS